MYGYKMKLNNMVHLLTLIVGVTREGLMMEHLLQRVLYIDLLV